jgi:hypothetical protein
VDRGAATSPPFSIRLKLDKDCNTGTDYLWLKHVIARNQKHSLIGLAYRPSRSGQPILFRASLVADGTPFPSHAEQSRFTNHITSGGVGKAKRQALRNRSEQPCRVILVCLRESASSVSSAWHRPTGGLTSRAPASERRCVPSACLEAGFALRHCSPSHVLQILSLALWRRVRISTSSFRGVVLLSVLDIASRLF